MQFKYEYKGKTHTIRLNKQADGTYQARIDERIVQLNAVQLKQGTWLIDIDGQRHTVYTASDKEQRYVQVAGTQYTLEKATRRRHSKQGGANSGDLTSEMPGQVIDVRVAEGDTVTAGQVLIVLEAMKMEIRIVAPHDGAIVRLLVAQGDIIERGQKLVEVAESDS